MTTPYLIGICGGSASGKTSVLEHLMEALPADSVTLIEQDNYYKDLEHQKADDNGFINFDHPDSVDLPLLERHIRELLKGQRVQIREYHYNNPEKEHLNRIITYKPAPVIIVEGMFVFHPPKLQNLLNLKVFVEADDHVKLTRRIRRDGTERGYPLEEVLAMYETHVMPMYRRYVEPYKHYANLVLQNNYDYRAATDVLVNHVLRVLETTPTVA
jgi:uridine kinase